MERIRDHREKDYPFLLVNILFYRTSYLTIESECPFAPGDFKIKSHIRTEARHTEHLTRIKKLYCTPLFIESMYLDGVIYRKVVFLKV